MATKLSGGAKFTYGAQGFAKLDIYKDGSSEVRFYSVKDNKIVYQANVLSANEKKVFNKFPSQNITSKKASIYTQKEVNKSKVSSHSQKTLNRQNILNTHSNQNSH